MPCLCVLLLTACTSADILDIGAIAGADDSAAKAAQVLKNKGRFYAANPEQLQADLKALKARIDEFGKLIAGIWGEDNAKQSGQKDYVKYTDQYYNCAHINFASGTVTIEALTPDDPRQVDLYSDAILDSNGKPFPHEQVLDQDGSPIAWQWRANRFAEYLIVNKITKVKIGKKNGLRVVFPLVMIHQQIRAYKYASLVREYSKKYRVTESLVYGIIKTESSFNPFAVSHAPAYGLMQVVPTTAGRDMFDKVKQSSGQPSPQNLYDPEYNIDIGTAYLNILQERYLVKIKDQNAKRYSVISAYNGGAGSVLKTFSSDRDQAVVKINQLSPNQVYQELTSKHPK